MARPDEALRTAAAAAIKGGSQDAEDPLAPLKFRFLTPEGEVVKPPVKPPSFFTHSAFGGSPNAYWSLHANERQGRRALQAREGGLVGKHIYSTSKGRNWKVEGLTVDPNRWFSEKGAEEHVRKKNPRASEAQVQKTLSVLSEMRKEFLPDMLPEAGGAIVSVHNSHPHVRYPGNKTIYQHERSKDLTKGVHEGDPADKLDFLLVTDPADFDRAVKEEVPFNVLYQAAGEVDDGSASVWASQQGIPYFNPEISKRKGAQEKQEKMLRWIEGRPQSAN